MLRLHLDDGPRFRALREVDDEGRAGPRMYAPASQTQRRKETWAGKNRIATEVKRRRKGHQKLKQKKTYDKYKGTTYQVQPTLPRGCGRNIRPCPTEAHP